MENPTWLNEKILKLIPRKDRTFFLLFSIICSIYPIFQTNILDLLFFVAAILSIFKLFRNNKWQILLFLFITLAILKVFVTFISIKNNPEIINPTKKQIPSNSKIIKKTEEIKPPVRQLISIPNYVKPPLIPQKIEFVVITGKIFDKKTSSPIKNLSIEYEKNYYLTDSFGKFTIPYSKKNIGIGFGNLYIGIDRSLKRFKNDNIRDTIQLDTIKYDGL